MKFSEMKKEQKQMLILAVGGVITLLSVTANIIIGPAREAAADAKKRVELLEDDGRTGESVLTTGERLLKRDPLVRGEVTQMAEEILTIHRDHLPPRVSPYIWAVGQLDLLAEKLDLDIRVQEHLSDRYVRVPQTLDEFNENSVPYWIPYTVDVEMDTSFANLQRFVALLREDLPYAAVAGLRIQASVSDPEHHEISLMVEWPTFRFGEDLAWLQEVHHTESP